jgi:hypothetical protein
MISSVLAAVQIFSVKEIKFSFIPEGHNNLVLTILFYIPLIYAAILSHIVLIIFPDVACLTAFDIGRKCSLFLEKNPDMTIYEVI